MGKLLRSAREEQNRSLAEIADELCITQRYLRAIEEDDLANLPGAFFYKSFVRQYAATVGVDPRQIQSGVEALVAGSEPPSLPPGEEASGRGEALSPWLLDTIDLIRDTGRPARAESAPSVSVRRSDPLVEDFNRYFSDRRMGMSLAGLAVALLASSGFYAWWSKTPDAPSAAGFPGPSNEPVAETRAASRETPLTVSSFPDQNGVNHAVLNISATEKTWLSITSDGKLIFSGILEPSQTKTLTGVERAQMKVGNAGGLEVRWKGRDIGPIGPRGQVRTVLFKTDDVEILKYPLESSEL